MRKTWTYLKVFKRLLYLNKKQERHNFIYQVFFQSLKKNATEVSLQFSDSSSNYYGGKIYSGANCFFPLDRLLTGGLPQVTQGLEGKEGWHHTHTHTPLSKILGSLVTETKPLSRAKSGQGILTLLTVNPDSSWGF